MPSLPPPPVNPTIDNTIAPLPSTQKIINSDGTPNNYFIRWAQERSIDISQGITYAQLIQVLGEIFVVAQDGLVGGGAIDTSITVGIETVSPPVAGAYTNLNATIDAYGRVIVAADGSSGTLEVTDGTHDFTDIIKLLITGGVVSQPVAGEAEITITPASSLEVSDGVDDYTGIDKLLFVGATVSNPTADEAEITIDFPAAFDLEVTDGTADFTAIDKLLFVGATVSNPTAGEAEITIDFPTPPAAQIWAPTVTGVIPAGFMVDGLGQCIMTRIV